MSAKKKSGNELPLISNSKARHKFTIGDKYEAGIQLRGTEVKSVRSGSAQISESFARIVKDELFLFNAHIAEYEFGGDQNHEPQRPRKLLLKKKEIERLQKEVANRDEEIQKLKQTLKEAVPHPKIPIKKMEEVPIKKEEEDRY